MQRVIDDKVTARVMRDHSTPNSGEAFELQYDPQHSV